METTTLLTEIEAIRKQLIENGLSEGLTSPKTIELSQKLDHLLNLLR